jgi:hypothetical protein
MTWEIPLEGDQYRRWIGKENKKRLYNYRRITERNTL